MNLAQIIMKAKYLLLFITSIINLINAQNRELNVSCEDKFRIEMEKKLRKMNYWYSPYKTGTADPGFMKCNLHSIMECKECHKAENFENAMIEYEYNTNVKECNDSRLKTMDSELLKQREIESKMVKTKTDLRRKDFITKLNKEKSIKVSKNKKSNPRFFFMSFSANWGSYDCDIKYKTLYISDVLELSAVEGCNTEELCKLINQSNTPDQFNCSFERSKSSLSRSQTCATLWFIDKINEICPCFKCWYHSWFISSWLNEDLLYYYIDQNSKIILKCKTGNEPECYCSDKNKLEVYRKKLIESEMKNHHSENVVEIHGY